MKDAVLSSEEITVPESETDTTEAAETFADETEDKTDTGTDYEEIIREDIETLRGEFSELSALRDITELENPMRYAALRDLGLSPAEAYLATTRHTRKRDNRSHLHTAVPRMAAIPKGYMSDRELEAARELFSDMSDAEIRKLYKKVTK